MNSSCDGGGGAGATYCERRTRAQRRALFLKYLRLAYLRLALEARALEARPMLRLPFQREVSYVVVLYVVAASRRGAAARSLVAAGDVVLLQCAASSHRFLYARRASARCVDALEAFATAVYARQGPQRGKTVNCGKRC